MQIRESRPEEFRAIEAIYPAVFPEEDLVPLVRALLGEATGVLSLVATRSSRLLGHAAFTRCAIAGQDQPLALLGPLAVSPGCQKQGIGTRLVESGLTRLAGAAYSRVLVLGDPAYYARFGFLPEKAVQPPYELPPEWVGAWQSKDINPASDDLAGQLVVPAPWRDLALWLP